MLFSNVAAANELNIYSHRQPFLIEPFLKAFTEKTGIKTNVLYSTKGLAQRLKHFAFDLNRKGIPKARFV